MVCQTIKYKAIIWLEIIAEFRASLLCCYDSSKFSSVIYEASIEVYKCYVAKPADLWDYQSLSGDTK